MMCHILHIWLYHALIFSMAINKLRVCYFLTNLQVFGYRVVHMPITALWISRILLKLQV